MWFLWVSPLLFMVIWVYCYLYGVHKKCVILQQKTKKKNKDKRDHGTVEKPAAGVFLMIVFDFMRRKWKKWLKKKSSREKEKEKER